MKRYLQAIRRQFSNNGMVLSNEVARCIKYNLKRSICNENSAPRCITYPTMRSIGWTTHNLYN